ncbi:Transposase InsO and inactivated derivatives [Mariniphaga anaerophila]|uniref:Transposase InsO and inactivated derivatives n=1 Tax=Mariniphaga anaerophila TaxID=1484053 RepID=A0A1M5GWW7_9BACT|nr:integrase core domain-containing protein [Mariniphaga anaerophila]SHG08213.1 Transposase InsO and inactivated derivatives [Mariniphaga anaerophila]
MPWKEKTIMEEKVEFICEWNSGKYTITELCKGFGISRTTAYRMIQRYEKFGIEGLRMKDKAPINHPNRTNKEIEKRILCLKDKHQRWGAKKLRILLFNDFPEKQIPSVVTVHNILSRNGLVCPQKRLRRVKPLYPIFDPKDCNEVWSADYKGKFLMGNKKYCHPLTIADSKSRFLFTAKAHHKENYKSVKEEFTRVFRKFGLPKQVHTDNGIPFGSVSAIQRFTTLSYWFIDLGVLPVFSDPAHPEQNGRHERMHRDLKAACASPSAFDLRSQQRKLNYFVKEYNSIRPHEALDMKTPAQAHQFSNKPFPEKIEPYIYPAHMKTMNVSKSGAMRWKAYYWVYMSSGLIGRQVAAEEIGNGVWKVFYRNVFLGYFNEKDIRDKQNITRLSTNLV